VQPRERSLDVQSRTGDGEGASGTKVSRASATSPMSPRLRVDGKLARGPHTRAPGGGGGGENEEGFTSELLDGLDVAASYSYRQESGPGTERNFRPFLPRLEEFGIMVNATIGRQRLLFRSFFDRPFFARKYRFQP